MDVEGVKQHCDLTLCDLAALVVRRPDVKRIPAQLGDNVFRSDLNLASLDEHGLQCRQQALAIRRLLTAAGQTLSRLASPLRPWPVCQVADAQQQFPIHSCTIVYARWKFRLCIL